jgi:SAM-dependent methyltransferase
MDHEMTSYAKLILDANIMLIVDKFGGSILDFGCGTAPYIDIYREKTSKITLSDITKKINFESDFIVSNGNASLEFQNQEFDTIFCSEVLEHISNPFNLMNEFSRILKSQGTLIVTCPFIYPMHEIPNDFWRITPYAMKHLAEMNSFTITQVIQVGNLYHVIVDFVDKFLQLTLGKKSAKLAGYCSNQLLSLSKKNFSQVFDLNSDIKNFDRYSIGYIYILERNFE